MSQLDWYRGKLLQIKFRCFTEVCQGFLNIVPLRSSSRFWVKCNVPAVGIGVRIAQSCITPSSGRTKCFEVNKYPRLTHRRPGDREARSSPQSQTKLRRVRIAYPALRHRLSSARGRVRDAYPTGLCPPELAIREDSARIDCPLCVYSDYPTADQRKWDKRGCRDEQNTELLNCKAFLEAGGSRPHASTRRTLNLA